ncbi:MAG TPA: hypothetical protein VIZ30_01880 [Pseudomonadales bacterium]
MHRTQAFLIHLGISLSIFAVLAYLVVKVWYPDFFFETDGGWQGLRLLLGVDLVLGPLLTLIVYRAGKPGLRFDLTAIGVIQATCLAAGIWIVHGERPLAMVYSDGSFYSVTAQSFKEVNAPVPDLDAFPGPYPKWVSVKLPEDLEEQSNVRGEMFRGGRMLSTASEYYAAFKPEDVDVKEARDIKEITDWDRDSLALPRWMQDHGGTLANYRFFLFGARYVYAYLGFSVDTGRFVGFLDTPAHL